MRTHITLAVVVAFMPQLGRGQHSESKPAEQGFKNITQLKGIPADQVMPSMQFISAALGVECSFCHVPGKMDADDKPEKKTAREMMAMTAAINKNSFSGQQRVTCYSCHHGSAHPAGTPPVLESDAPARSEPRAVPSSSVDEIVDRYVTALGGAGALSKVSSRLMTGMIHAGGTDTPIELITKAPNKRISITHAPKGASYTAFDGTAGWLGNTGRPAREMSAAESSAAAIDAEFSLALRLKEMFPQLRRGRAEEINGVDCETLIGTARGRPQVRLYFDAKSGLLVRMVRYAETPLGRNPTQIDYADYRDVDGVRIPFRWTLARPNGRFTIQIAEAKSNIAIDDGRFTKPTGDVK